MMASLVAAKFNEQGAGGWSWILSDLKSVLETGASMDELKIPHFAPAMSVTAGNFVGTSATRSCTPTTSPTELYLLRFTGP